MKVKNSILKRILAIIGFAFMVIVIMDFNGRMTHLTALKYERIGEQQRLDELEATETALKEELYYASSDDAAEDWARSFERMARDGDFPIVILPGDEVASQVTTEETENTETFSNFENWMRWLFGTP